MALPGSAAGLCWCVSNVFNTLAVQQGGGAITGSISTAAGLITSGLWGMLYYKEIRGRAALQWAAWGCCTVAMATLLAFEKK